MSYIRTIAWGMLDIDELEPQTIDEVIDGLRAELRANGMDLSPWPTTRRYKTQLRPSQVSYTLKLTMASAYSAPLRECCRRALSIVEPHNHQR